ncbi:MAG: putative drug exporter of the superfamily [Thermoleophilaceae bacterium]|nr:putative drug exporter of the superfamily [Thermoleophilaceae bacterium]
MFTRLADTASSYPKRIVLGAILLALVAGALGAGVASRLGPYSAEDPASESVRTYKDLERATGVAATSNAVVLVRGDRPVRSRATRARVGRIARKLAADPAVARVASFYTTRSPAMVSRDGRSTFVVASLKAGADDQDAVASIRSALRSERGVTVGGGAAAGAAANDIVSSDLKRAELLAAPLLFLLSLWFFRSLVAAALPLLVGVVSILLTFFALRLVSEVVDLSVFALNLVTGLGLGLAIDYSLFVVSRHREEMAKSGPGRAALRRTVATAGRTVLFSSLTVAAAMASLLVFPQEFLYSMGVGGVLVAVIASTVALVLLPAVLALLGERVNALAPARLRRAAAAEAGHEARGFWYRLSRFVMRRPGRVAVSSAAFLIALGLPFLGVKFTSVDVTVLPTDEPARQVDTALKTEFPPNETDPIVVAVKAPAAGPATRQVVAGLRRLPDVTGVSAPIPAGRDLTRLNVVQRSADLDQRSQDLVRRIRAMPAPAEVAVTGRTAAFVDLKASLAHHMPLALGLLAASTLIVLFLMTGSVILPVKALVMNLLTLSAAFGLLVLIFQDGRLQGPLGYVSQGALDTSQPVVLFAIAFGLSTDYGVFLLSRIKEARDAGAPNREAVAIGLERTGRIVTAAALLFCVAIGAFATSRIIFIKEVGIGTALAVLIDATIVRALLVPSLMELLGNWNWWAPRPLRRLHRRFGLSETAPGEEAGAAA